LGGVIFLRQSVTLYPRLTLNLPFTCFTLPSAPPYLLRKDITRVLFYLLAKVKSKIVVKRRQDANHKYLKIEKTLTTHIKHSAKI
jgi:hypothetical protein